MASGYIIETLRKTPVTYYLYTSILVLLGASLQAWPNSSGVLPGLNLNEIPSYSREAKRVFADTCNAIQDHSGGNKLSILMPAISLMINPDLIELCGLERDVVSIDAPKIYMHPYSQMLATIQSSVEYGEANMLALVLSTDFPGIPGNMPTSKHMGSLNHLFSSSTRFELASIVRGPNGTGNIRLFKKIAAFSPVENVVGMKGFEGPYPEKKIPIVRWTLFPASEFDIQVSQGHRTRLAIAGLPAQPQIIANIQLSTGDKKNCEFAANTFTECHLDFVAQTNNVHVKIEPHSPDQIESTPKTGEAILFSRIEVVDMEKAVAKVQKQRESLFSCIDFLDGFGNIEGPYKKLNLPVVIWGRGDFSRIGIANAHNLSGMLVIEWRPGETVQAIEILHGNNSIGRCMSGEPSNDFRSCQLHLPHETNSSDLILRYIGDKQILSNKMNNSALFKRIQIIEKND